MKRARIENISIPGLQAGGCVKYPQLLLLLGVVLLVSFGCDGENLRPERQWGQYRGYLASGVLDQANLPDSFDLATGKNVKWKIPVPGLGISCPVIWGDNLFLTTAISSVDTSGFKIGIYGDIAPVTDSSVHEWKVFCYNKTNGSLLWNMSGGGDIPIPTPIIGDSLIYMNSAHGPSYPVMAIRKGARGDITLKDQQTSSEHISWYLPKGGSYMATMLLYGKYLYNCNLNGSVICYEAATGRVVYKDKLGKNKSFTGSPVASDGKIYIADEEGTVYVFRAGPEFKLLSANPLNDICMTTPGITDNLIYFRTEHYLFAVGN